MSIKIKLAEQYVPGNIKNFLQICKIYYYPPEQDFPLDKVWIYFDGEENKQPRRIRSLCFKNPENHKQFILNNIYAHIYQLLKRAADVIPEVQKSRYQNALLDDFLMKARKEIKNKFKDQANGVYRG